MSNTEKVTGRCECGGIQYEVSSRDKLRQIVACHCEQCRRITGNFATATAARKKYVKFLSEETLTWYNYQSGMRQGFCNRCGSNLFFEQTDGDRLSIAAGSLDDDAGLKIAAHIYVNEAGSYYHLNDDVPLLDARDHTVELPK